MIKIHNPEESVLYELSYMQMDNLMPISELRAQVNKRRNSNRTISMDDVLEIADYFGVSFQTCLFRIAYLIHAIPGNTEANELRKRATKYGPDKERKRRHMTCAAFGNTGYIGTEFKHPSALLFEC